MLLISKTFCFTSHYSSSSILSATRKVLATLDQTRSDAKVMKKAIKNTTGKFEDAKVRTEQLLVRLSNRATVLEKLKAKVGLSTSLDAYLHLNEMEAEQQEEDELLKQGERSQNNNEVQALTLIIN